MLQLFLLANLLVNKPPSWLLLLGVIKFTRAMKCGSLQNSKLDSFMFSCWVSLCDFYTCADTIFGTVLIIEPFPLFSYACFRLFMAVSTLYLGCQGKRRYQETMSGEGAIVKRLWVPLSHDAAYIYTDLLTARKLPKCSHDLLAWIGFCSSQVCFTQPVWWKCGEMLELFRLQRT